MKGIVVCEGPRAAEEGARVMEAGGNAFDAAIATSFVQMVILPFSCGVGGMVSAHLYSAARRDHWIIDGCLRAGSQVSEEMWAADCKGEAAVSGASIFEDSRSTMGYTSVCTPGAVAALAECHKRYSSMPWSELLEPAIRIAREGFPLTRSNRDLLVTPGAACQPSGVERVSATRDSARIYLRPDGSVPEEGSTIRNPDYADTLTQLAKEGPEDFYQGALADVIAADLQKNGSFVTRQDLSEYQISSYRPYKTSYHGYDVYTNGPPGAGPLLIEALNVLDGLDLGKGEHGGADYLKSLAPTLQLVNQDRRDFLGDPEVIGAALSETLTSKQRAKELQRAVLSGAVGTQAPPPEGPDTTHLVAVDTQGHVASITHSNGDYSGVVSPGMGFQYNNGMNRFDPRPGRASSFAPRKARLHLMMPSIAFQHGAPAVAFGAPGGNAILSAMTQSFTNVVDFGMNATEAVSAPRIHAEESTVWCESRIRADAVTALREAGHKIIQDPNSHGWLFARAQLVTIAPDGKLDGGSDPRRSDSGVAVARG